MVAKATSTGVGFAVGLLVGFVLTVYFAGAPPGGWDAGTMHVDIFGSLLGRKPNESWTIA